MILTNSMELSLLSRSFWLLKECKFTIFYYESDDYESSLFSFYSYLSIYSNCSAIFSRFLIVSYMVGFPWSEDESELWNYLLELYKSSDEQTDCFIWFSCCILRNAFISLFRSWADVDLSSKSESWLLLNCPLSFISICACWGTCICYQSKLLCTLVTSWSNNPCKLSSLTLCINM